MFELEEYSTGFHDGFLSKYTDSSGPTLDFYISDSMQDMLDIDIRSEIENVVGDPDFSSSMNLPHSLDQALNSSSNTASSTHNGNGQHSIHSNHHTLQSASLISSNWYGENINGGSSWSSSSNDYFADIGACVNPISVMPLISSSLLQHKSPKPNLNSNGLPPPPASPNASESSKSHLTFSPAQMKISANSIRHEQLLSHIPKQIVPISSTVTAATTAPATMATNSALQRKNGNMTSSAAVEAIKKDLGSELRRSSSDDGIKAGVLTSNGILNGATQTNTIKLAPGIGGLTFANSITYNKLKHQATTKSPLSSPNSAMVIAKRERERDSSPLHMLSNNGGSGNSSGQNVSKIIARNMAQSANGFTPKSIASAHSPLMHSGGSSGSIGSPSSASSMSASSPSSHSSGYNGSFSAGLAPLNNGNAVSMKSLQQKHKLPIIESEYPKPAYSYSCLIAMALKNSRSGSLPVSEIYRFMCEHFPYFNTAPSGWKNSVRHNLSLNKCFEKIEKPATNGNQRKGCLWAMNPDRITKMDEEVQKWSRKDPAAIRNAMVYPENLEALERGEMKHGSLADDVEADSQSDIEDTSDLEEPEDIDETIVDSMFVEEDEDVVAEDEMLHNEIVVMHENSNTEMDEDCMNTLGDDIKHDVDTDLDDKEFLQLHQQQQQRDFDIEVEDIYDSIDIEDDKEAVRMALNQSDIIELSPADLNASAPSSLKRARLDVNYSIGPVNELEKHLQQQKLQQQQQTFKKFKLVQQVQQQQHLHQHQHQHQSQQLQAQKAQHFIVTTATTMPTATATTKTKTANIATIITANNNFSSNLGTKLINANNNNNSILLQKQIQHLTQFQQITAIPQHNRRKMQLVNRIA